MLILKTIILSTSGWPDHTKNKKNKLCQDGNNNSKIVDKNTNLSISIKKMSSEAGFFTLKASLAFANLRKAFIKILILYYFDLECYI